MKTFEVSGIRVWVDAEQAKDASIKVAKLLISAVREGKITEFDGSRFGVMGNFRVTEVESPVDPRR